MDIFSKVILLLPLLQEGMLSLESTALPLSLSLPRKNVVMITDYLDMTIAVDWDIKPQKKTNIARLPDENA